MKGEEITNERINGKTTGKCINTVKRAKSLHENEIRRQIYGKLKKQKRKKGNE
jgi:hypothetical protein